MRAFLVAVPLCLLAWTGVSAAENSYSAGYTLGCFNGSVFAGNPVPDMDPDPSRMERTPNTPAAIGMVWRNAMSTRSTRWADGWAAAARAEAP